MKSASVFVPREVLFITIFVMKYVMKIFDYLKLCPVTADPTIKCVFLFNILNSSFKNLFKTNLIEA